MITLFTLHNIESDYEDLLILLKKLKETNLIYTSEKNHNGDYVYYTKNIRAVEKFVQNFDGIFINKIDTNI